MVGIEKFIFGKEDGFFSGDRPSRSCLILRFDSLKSFGVDDLGKCVGLGEPDGALRDGEQEGEFREGEQELAYRDGEQDGASVDSFGGV